MNWLDIIFILSLIGGTVLGIYTGLVRQLARIVSLVIAAYLAIIGHKPIAEWLSTKMSDPFLVKVIVFVFVFVCIYLILFCIIWFIERGISSSKLSPVDRVLGGLSGLLKTALICGTLLLGLAFYPATSLQRPVKNSALAPHLLGFTRRVVFMMPKKYHRQVKHFTRRLTKERTAAPETSQQQPKKGD